MGLANLEKSIKTLEKHLKCLNKKDPRQQQQQQQKVIRNQEQIQESIIQTNVNADDHTKRLPTIVEGMDNNNAMALVPYSRTDNETTTLTRQRKRDWTADNTDDSLLDLDLDTFLLIDEMRDKKKKSSFIQMARGEGIENPTFQSDDEHETANAVHPVDSGRDDDDAIGGDEDDDDDVEQTDNEGDNHKSTDRTCDENNYKCTKYINSCPDDAYNVDEIADYKYEQAHFPFANKLLPFYMKNIEDQLNHQNTKDILEEIRDKLTILMNPNADTEHESSTESDGVDSSKSNSKTVSLVRNITALKHDVENYLILMNQQNELEIRAFCTGLSKNYKLLTMQHALDNRTRRPKVSTSDIGSEVYSNSNSSSSRHLDQSLVRRKRRLKNQMKRNRKFVFWHRISFYSSNFDKFFSSFPQIFLKFCLFFSCFNNFCAKKNVSFSEGKNQMRTWKNQSKNSLIQLEHGSIRYSSSDSNFQLQRRHSDSICSSWEEAQRVSTTSSGRGSSSSAQR